MTGHQNPALARLYQEAIRRHAANPAGYRQAIEATHRHEAYNPLCGDRVEVRLQVSEGRVEAAAFDGEACAICTASASLLCTLAPGHPVERLRQLHDELRKELADPAGARNADDRADAPDAGNLPPELHPLLGVRPYPSRVRCATLPWDAAASALSG